MKRENKVINRTSQVSKFINDLHKYDSNICRLTILLNLYIREKYESR